MKKQIRNKKGSATAGLLLLTGLLLGSGTMSAQTTYTGTFRTPSGNTAYHHFTRNGVAAAVYINQEDINFPILRLSSGTAVAGQGVLFTVQGNGNVGIGTTSPTHKLTVSGDMTSINPNNSSAALRLGWKDNVARIRIGGEGTGAGNGLDIQRYSDVSLMRILGNGNVGIGTTTPNAKLAVNGNVRAKEVKVETANWPDYVFGEGYKLPDLKELSAYIRENRHLPGMPSASEAEADGIDLGEMNRKLLEKVEELTLLLIEERHRGEQREKRIKRLEILHQNK